MPTLAPTGPITDAIAGAMALLANAPYFQTWVGAGSASAAMANIFAMESGYPIASIAIAAGVLTVQTQETHALQIGQKVTLSGSALGAQSAVPLGGTYTVLSVTSNAFTVATGAANVSQTYEDFAFVTPGARPFATVMRPKDRSLRSRQIGTGGGMINSGLIEVLIEANTSAQYHNDPVNAPLEMDGAVDALIQSMQSINNTGLAVFTDANSNSLEFIANTIDLAVAAEPIGNDEKDDGTLRFERWRALIEITWGFE